MISLSAAELKKSKIEISGKGLKKNNPLLNCPVFKHPEEHAFTLYQTTKVLRSPNSKHL